MDELMDPYRVYVQTDEQGRITAVNSSAFVPDDWGTEIDQGYGDKYHHAQGNYFFQPIYTEDGIPRYKLVDGSPVERTEEEIGADRLFPQKMKKIAQSKIDLTIYLESHPLQWADGEYYSITQDKQNQLTSTLLSAQIDSQKPEWNSTGLVCKEWEIEELMSLGVAIKNRVKKLVKYQQQKEIEINNAKSMNELNSIIINYDEVK